MSRKMIMLSVILNWPALCFSPSFCWCLCSFSLSIIIQNHPIPPLCLFILTFYLPVYLFISLYFMQNLLLHSCVVNLNCHFGNLTDNKSILRIIFVTVMILLKVRVEYLIVIPLSFYTGMKMTILKKNLTTLMHILKPFFLNPTCCCSACTSNRLHSFRLD